MSEAESSTAIPERPLLRGDRVWLRPLEARDMPAYVAGINDTEVGAYAGYRMPFSLEQATAWHTPTLGFRREGVMRRSFRVNGTMTDSLLMAILRDEWDGARKSGA